MKVLIVSKFKQAREIQKSVVEELFPNAEFFLVADAKQSLEIFNSEITLVITGNRFDPWFGMTGSQMAVEMKKINPQVKLVLTSGVEENDTDVFGLVIPKHYGLDVFKDKLNHFLVDV